MWKHCLIRDACLWISYTTLSPPSSWPMLLGEAPHMQPSSLLLRTVPAVTITTPMGILNGQPLILMMIYSEYSSIVYNHVFSLLFQPLLEFRLWCDAICYIGLWHIFYRPYTYFIIYSPSIDLMQWCQCSALLEFRAIANLHPVLVCKL